MKLNVRLFAKARDLAGNDIVELDLPNSPCVADVKSVLGEMFPAMAPLLPSLLISVGNEYADDSTPLDGTRELACFPPVSGG